MDNKPTRQYINGIWIRSHRFADGGEILKLSIPADKIDAVAAQLKGAVVNGWARACSSAKRTPDEKSSHSIYVDTYQPKPKVEAEDVP